MATVSVKVFNRDGQLVGPIDVPRVEKTPEQWRAQLTEEICRASRALLSRFSPDKINVGALGNLVPQLHVHVIARSRDDPAWPGPVWGKQPPVPYESAALQERMEAVKAGFAES